MMKTINMSETFTQELKMDKKTQNSLFVKSSNSLTFLIHFTSIRKIYFISNDFSFHLTSPPIFHVLSFSYVGNTFLRISNSTLHLQTHFISAETSGPHRRPLPPPTTPRRGEKSLQKRWISTFEASKQCELQTLNKQAPSSYLSGIGLARWSRQSVK